MDRRAEDLAGAARGEVVAEAVAVAVGDVLVAAEDRLGVRLGVHLGAPEARAVRAAQVLLGVLAAQGVQAAQVLPVLEAPVRRPADHLAQVCPSFQHLSQSTNEKKPLTPITRFIKREGRHLEQRWYRVQWRNKFRCGWKAGNCLAGCFWGCGDRDRGLSLEEGRER